MSTEPSPALSELLQMLDESRTIPGYVKLPREAANMLIDHIAVLAAHPTPNELPTGLGIGSTARVEAALNTHRAVAVDRTVTICNCDGTWRDNHWHAHHQAAAVMEAIGMQEGKP